MADIADTITDPKHAIKILTTHLVHQVSSGHFGEVAVRGDVATLLGDDGLGELATIYSRLVKAEVNLEQDTDTGVAILRPLNKNSESKLVVQFAPSGKGKIPRPPNSFILYRSHHHPLLKARYPGMHNNDISIILGKKWKSEPQAVKKHWQKMAKVRAEQHILDHPNYSYTPRKPSEKKRRMKRNGATESVDAAVAMGSSLPHNMAEVNPVAINIGETSADASIVPEPLDDPVSSAPVLGVDENGQIFATLGNRLTSVAELQRTLQLYHDSNNIQPPRNEVEAAFRPFAEAQGDFTISTVATSHDHMVNMKKYRQGIIQQAKMLDAQYLAFDAIFDPNFLNTEHGVTGIGINSTAGSVTENTLLTLPVFEGFSSEELATEVL